MRTPRNAVHLVHMHRITHVYMPGVPFGRTLPLSLPSTVITVCITQLSRADWMPGLAWPGLQDQNQNQDQITGLSPFYSQFPGC